MGPIFTIVMVLVAAIIGAYLDVKISQSRKSKAVQNRRIYSDLDKAEDKAWQATNAKAVKSALNEYKTLISEAGDFSPSSQDYYRYELRSMQDMYEDMANEEWKSKADKILNQFLDTYIMITVPTFDNVEKAYRSKKRCLDLWQSYRTSVIDDTGVRYDWIGYLKEYTASDFDECMLSKESLEKKLTSCIDDMKPEYRRKLALRDKLVDFVQENEPVMRARLLSSQIEGASEKEVKLCYKELLEKYRIVEYKIGNRYMVTLSDKEKEKRKAKKDNGTVKAKTDC